MNNENLEKIMTELHDTKVYLFKIVSRKWLINFYDETRKDIIEALNNLMNTIFNELIS